MALKKCPYCYEEIQQEAILCKHCKSSLVDEEGRMIESVTVSGPENASLDGQTPVEELNSDNQASVDEISSKEEQGSVKASSDEKVTTAKETRSAAKVNMLHEQNIPHKRDRRILELVLGLLGGIGGLFSGVFALFFGGIDAAFNGTGTSILGGLGVSAILFSILGIVGAVLVGKNGKLGGLFMTVAAVCGFISVFMFYIIPGILLLIGGIMGLVKPIQAETTFKWKKWAPITVGMIALIFIISMSSSGEGAETKEVATGETDTYEIGEEISVENLTYKVLGIYSADAVEDMFSVEEAAGTFVILDVEVTNNDKEARTIDSALFKLKTEDGTEFNPSTSASMTLNENAEFFLTQLNPQLSTRGYVAFDVPQVEDELLVEFSAGMFSSKNKVVKISSSQVAAADDSATENDEDSVGEVASADDVEDEVVEEEEAVEEEKSESDGKAEENSQGGGTSSDQGDSKPSSGNEGVAGEQVSGSDEVAEDPSADSYNENEIYYDEIYFDDGSSYQGELKNGVYHGYGVYRWADGTVYEGDFVNNYMEGFGFMKWWDGTVYNGEFYNDQPHGYGEMIWPDGTVFIGEFAYGETTENGEWVYP